MEWEDSALSVRQQCELLGLNRSTAYYAPAGETEENLCLMRRIDEQYLKTPWYGSRRMTVWLTHHGLAVNRKRVQRLMRLMDIEAIYPKPRTTEIASEHRKFPYLLRDRAITKPDEVWAERIKDLSSYKVTKEVMANGKKEAIFLHCLPSFHDLNTGIGKEMGERFGLKDMEVTDEVFQSEQSKVFQEAENRMHTIKAVMAATLGA